MLVRSRIRRRGGATAVEAAVVMSVFLMFLFGIFEYCRFLMMLHVTTNAARDAARYAVVNVDKPANFDVAPYTDPGGRVFPSITAYCNSKMMAVRGMLGPTYLVRVFPCDDAALAAATPSVIPKAGYPATVPWNKATFGYRIAVEVTGEYTPVLPTFLIMPSTIDVNIAVTMGSEG